MGMKLVELLLGDENSDIMRVGASTIEPAFCCENSLNIVFSFNQSFFQYFFVALKSLIDNSSSDKFYDIVVFNSDIDLKSYVKIKSILPDNFSVRIFDISNYIKNEFSNVELKPYFIWSVEMYNRIFIPFLMEKYDKVLYLDSDLIINNDLSELFQIQSDNKPIMAVNDFSYLAENNIDKTRLRDVLNVDNSEKYFNSGVLLFNIKKIDKSLYKKAFVEASKIKDLLHPDQDILNKIFNNQVYYLDFAWNFSVGPFYADKNFLNKLNDDDKNELLKAYKTPKIIHYTSSHKPWNSKLDVLDGYFWKYGKQTDFFDELITKREILIKKNDEKKYDLNQKLYSKLLTNKKVVLWGASLFLESFFDEFEIKNDNIIGIIDFDVSRHGAEIGGYKIISADKINEIKPDEIILTIINRVDVRKKEIEDFLDGKYVVSTIV